LTYGAVLMALSMLIATLTWRFGTIARYIGLATGFVFIGPALAVGRIPSAGNWTGEGSR